MEYLPNVSLKHKDTQLDLLPKTWCDVDYDKMLCPICQKKPLNKSYWACKKCIKTKSADWLIKFLVENQQLLFL